LNQKQAIAPAASLVALRDIVCHPLRVQALTVLTERKASVAELAVDLGADKGTLAYHVKKLREAGAVEVVETRKTRGPDEHFFRAVQRPLISEAETAEMPATELVEWLERILALILADTTASLQSGIFIRRPDHNFIRFPTTVDEEGWAELGEVLHRALDEAMDIEARSAARMLEDPDSVSIPARFVSMLFEMPSPGDRGGD
jgi:DNA-binding transcriptional ArsR family regulator